MKIKGLLWNLFSSCICRAIIIFSPITEKKTPNLIICKDRYNQKLECAYYIDLIRKTLRLRIRPKAAFIINHEKYCLSMHLSLWEVKKYHAIPISHFAFPWEHKSFCPIQYVSIFLNFLPPQKSLKKFFFPNTIDMLCIFSFNVYRFVLYI